jgi:hypothetical protein
MIRQVFFKVTACIALVIAITGCGGGKFDRQKWSYGDGLDYPLRDEILNDLVTNHHIKGLNYRQVIDSLGSPQRRDSLQFTYQIFDDTYQYSRKKPAHKKNLILYFNKDSVVTRFEIYDHTDKEKKKK